MKKNNDSNSLQSGGKKKHVLSGVQKEYIKSSFKYL